MENRFNIDTKYKAIISFDDYSSVNDIIVSYYLPIIKSEAFSLYSALVIDARNPMINTMYTTLERLVSMINLSLIKIEDAVARLELVNLIEVLKDEDNRICFRIKKPLSPEEFNASEQFTELLKSSAGDDNLHINNRLFNSMREIEDSHLESTTKDVDLSIIKDKPEAKLNVEYDFDSIKNILEAKGIDWKHVWNEELEEKLLNVIVIYKVSAFDIAIELIKELELPSFSSENLVKRIKDEYTHIEDISSIILAGENTTEIKMDYLSNLAVKDFFIHRLTRVPSPTEEEMITTLINKYGLNNHQINILIDYSIIVNEGGINKNYIYKIADTMLKENLNTPEKLIQHLKVSYKLKTKKETESKTASSKKLMDDAPIF